MKKPEAKKSRDTVPLNITKETFRLTVPPEVVLLNYMTIRELVPKLGFFAGYSLHTVLVSLFSPEGSARLRWRGWGAQRPVLRFPKYKNAPNPPTSSAGEFCVHRKPSFPQAGLQIMYMFGGRFGVSQTGVEDGLRSTLTDFFNK
jgi:hypothetical protein